MNFCRCNTRRDVTHVLTDVYWHLKIASSQWCADCRRVHLRMQIHGILWIRIRGVTADLLHTQSCRRCLTRILFVWFHRFSGEKFIFQQLIKAMIKTIANENHVCRLFVHNAECSLDKFVQHIVIM